MLPQGVHFIASPIMAVLLFGLVIATERYWGGGWRIALALVVGLVPVFLIAHLIAMPIFHVLRLVSSRDRKDST
jgi:hypothetical protein